MAKGRSNDPKKNRLYIKTGNAYILIEKRTQKIYNLNLLSQFTSHFYHELRLFSVSI